MLTALGNRTEDRTVWEEQKKKGVNRKVKVTETIEKVKIDWGFITSRSTNENPKRHKNHRR